MVKFFNFQKLLVFFSFCGYLFAQDVPVSGTVTDSSGQPLPGVSVVIKDKKTGVQTDFDGNYKIEVAKGSVLVFSYVGMKSQEIQVTDEKVYDVILAEDSELQEVVVVGYGSKSKSTLTGSVASVKGEEINQAPAVNISNALQGRVSGLFVTQLGSEPGQGDATLRIRGVNTFKNSSPLVVIDGVPARQGGLSRINPADIQSVSVLKDASAAIYGSRAANGVILVTTKKGRAGTGKVSFSYTSNVGMSAPTQLPKMMTAAQYLDALNDVTIYDGVPVSRWKEAKTAFKNGQASYVYQNADGDDVTVNPFATQSTIDGHLEGKDPWKYPNTDWFAELIKPYSMQTRNTLQITGGTEKLNFYSSLGHLFQDGNYRNSATDYNQYDYRLNLNSQITSAIKLKTGLLVRQELRKYPVRGAGTIIGQAFQGKPHLPAWWPNGKPGPDIENGDNPAVIATDAGGYNNNNNTYLQTNFDVDVELLQGLTLKLSAAFDKNFTRAKRFEKPWYLYTWDGSTMESDGTTPRLEKGKKGFSSPQLSESSSEATNILYRVILQYNKTFADKHFVKVLLGGSQEATDYESHNVFRKNYISDKVDQVFAGGDAEKDNGGSSSQTARMSYFGRLNYEFDKKYLAEFIVRYDGSYLFPKENRFGVFPSASLGWVASEETFIKNALPFVSFLKLKVAYGQMGNDVGVSSFQYLSTYDLRTYITDGVTRKTVRESSLPNKDITWEVAENANVGIEARFLDDGLSVEFEYFKNIRDKILATPAASLPNFTGIPASEKNIGKVENQGFDFLVSYDGKINQDWRYSITSTGQYAKNKLVYWDEAVPNRKDYDTDEAYQYRMEVFERQRQEGRPLSSNLLYKYAGIFKDQAEIDANNIDYSELKSSGLQPGDMKYEDVNGDGKITADDRVRTDANSTPPLQASLQFKIAFKNFDFSILFQGMWGAERVVTFTRSGRIGNYPKHFYTRRWTIDNPSSVHPRMITERGNQYWASGNTYWIEDTDFIRLRQLQLGYNIPNNIARTLHLDGFRIFLNGSNLLTFTDAFFDPEYQLSYSYPITRVMNLGLSIKF